MVTYRSPLKTIWRVLALGVALALAFGAGAVFAVATGAADFTNRHF